MGRGRHLSLVGTVLVASAQPGRAGAIAHAFSRHGLVPTLGFTGPEVASVVEHHRFDLVAIDGDLPGDDGRALARTVATRSDAVVMLVGGRRPGLDVASGVHAHLAPGVPAEDVAAHGAALVGLRPGPAASSLEWGPLRLDPHRREGFWHDHRLELTPLQFRILATLVMARGGVVTREDLYRVVWRQAPIDDGERIVAHVRRIRSKIEAHPSRPTFLLTARGEGFRLADPPFTVLPVEPRRASSG
jgi:two-component system response regulator MtrA